MLKTLGYIVLTPIFILMAIGFFAGSPPGEGTGNPSAEKSILAAIVDQHVSESGDAERLKTRYLADLTSLCADKPISTDRMALCKPEIMRDFATKLGSLSAGNRIFPVDEKSLAVPYQTIVNTGIANATDRSGRVDAFTAVTVIEAALSLPGKK